MKRSYITLLLLLTLLTCGVCVILRQENYDDCTDKGWTYRIFGKCGRGKCCRKCCPNNQSPLTDCSDCNACTSCV